MWISYSDSEVNKFHPICEKALNNALVDLGKNTQYRVLHHQYTGALEMDFVIQNISTGKYFCVIEVKRTPADVHSARYQFQAMSYVQMNSEQSEKPFYILTNLERAFLFRYDSTRPRVFQQMLKPGLCSIGSFSQNEDVFMTNLSSFFKEQLEQFFNGNYEYLITLDEFARHMEQIKNNPKKWKSHLAILLYEYIRGAFTFINRNDLPDVRIFHNDVERICNEAARINFKDIFSYSQETFENPTIINNSTLSNLFDFGYQNVSGDSISGLLHQIVSAGHEHEGEVPTDLELGRIVSVLAKNISGEISENDFICDPAAGSGNLITTAVEIYNLLPKQILVNDWNKKLLELLSLRLGLNFAKQISKSNSPTIENKNIAFLEKDFFSNVKVIVMNPPFVAGINCIKRKQEIYRKLRELTNNNYKTNVGQMPLEATFLELITHLVKPGTTIACIFPKTHLTARGNEAQIIRSILLSNLGLHTIFTYPGDEIFDDVTKDTCVLIGKAMQPNEIITVFSSYDKVTDLDIHRFGQAINNALTNQFTSIMPGVVGRTIEKTSLMASLSDGWRELNSEMVEGINFVKTNFENSDKFQQLKDFSFEMKRGCAANGGGSDLIFIDSRKQLYSQFVNRNLVLKAAMRNAKHSSFCVESGDSKFLDIKANDETIINEIITAYLALPSRDGQQQRVQKTSVQLKTILEYESAHGFAANSVLIPRAIRREGKVYLSENPVFVSTNFVVCSTQRFRDALLLSTWISTIFYQLICEVASKDEEGMRKMEVNDIRLTFVPKMENIPDSVINELSQETHTLSFIDLKSPKIRNVDCIWARYLFRDNYKDKLNEATRLLSFLANRRNN